jgi:hypothetical protein
MSETQNTQGLTIGRGTAVHIRNREFDFLTPLCGGTRTNGPAQAKRLVAAVPTCKACLKATTK